LTEEQGIPPRSRRRAPRRASGAAPRPRDPSRTLSAKASSGSTARAVFVTEIHGLLRDRRALFSAFLLPVLLYPLLFLGNSWLARISKETLAARTVKIALDISAMPASEADRMRDLLHQEQPIELTEIDATRLLALGTDLETGATLSGVERNTVSAVLGGSGDLLLVARRLQDIPPYALRVYFDGQTDIGNEAQKRVDSAVQKLRRELRAQRIHTVLGPDPAHGLSVEPVDTASQADQSGATLGKYLPLIAVFVLLAGASYAALSAFAGERESGTLETLLVQPVPRSSIAAGKFAAVLVTGIATLVLNAGSVLVCLHLGLGALPSADLAASTGMIVDAGRLFSAAFLFLPAAVFLCAVLCLACGRARTFREGQQLLLPMMFLAILPTIPATQPDIVLDPLLAAIPLCGPALALRDALRGNVAIGMATWMFVANCAWAWLALAKLSSLLDAERVMQHQDNPEETATREVQSRYALRWAIVAVFAVYLIGATLQSWNLAWGLAATLWLVILPLALLSARGTAQRARETLREALWLRAPNALHALGAALIAPAFVLVGQHVFEWQKRVLPLPSSFGEVELLPAAVNDHPWLKVALIAISPAICEEMFFRGALLSGLRRDLTWWRVVIYEMIAFGAVHMSIYRFAPTAVLGGVLTLLTLRSKSLIPAMILHATYNGILVLQTGEGFDPRFAWLGVLGVLCFAATARADRLSRS
jgi:sodium transport system permease protein